MSSKKQLIIGLWENNPALVQMLGLCPLLATSTTLVNGFSMGIATMFVLIISTSLIVLIKPILPKSVRLPIFMLTISGSVTLVEILIQRFFYDLYLILGIFVPLIVTNCIIVGRSEAFASRNSFKSTLFDSLGMGVGFLWVLSAIGTIRELLTKGTIFSGLDTLLGDNFSNFSIKILPESTLLIATFPAGAFIIFAFILAFKNLIDNKKSNK